MLFMGIGDGFGLWPRHDTYERASVFETHPLNEAFRWRKDAWIKKTRRSLRFTRAHYV